MSHKSSIYLLHITLPILIAVISIFILADVVSESGYLAGVIAEIDESREDVLKLGASSTAVSVAITALPGDIATPVAAVLADLSKGFLVVLSALYLEKLLFPVIGMVVFKWLIPLSCIVYIVGFLRKRQELMRLSGKLLCFAVILFLMVPAEAAISGLIREKYGETLERTIESAENSARLMEESIEDNNVDEETGNGLGLILKNLQQTGDQIARGTSQFINYLEKLVNRFLEAIAVMLVTSCLIPVLVVLVFLWVTKLIFTVSSENNGKLIEREYLKERLRIEKSNEKEDS